MKWLSLNTCQQSFPFHCFSLLLQLDAQEQQRSIARQTGVNSTVLKKFALSEIQFFMPLGEKTLPSQLHFKNPL